MIRTRQTQSRWLGMIAGGVTALCLSFVLYAASPVTSAKADGYVSFGFGTSFSHGHRHHRYGRYHHGRRHYGHGYYRRGHYGHGHYGYPYYRHRTHRHRHVTYTQVVPVNPPKQVRSVRSAAIEQQRQDCRMIREYQTTITIGGKEVPAYGDACLQPDGSWRLGAPKPVPEG